VLFRSKLLHNNKTFPHAITENCAHFIILEIALFTLLRNMFIPLTRVEVEVTLRLTASQTVSLRVEPALGLVTRYYFLSEGCCLVSVGRPL
jgi:hypothetical protein